MAKEFDPQKNYFEDVAHAILYCFQANNWGSFLSTYCETNQLFPIRSCQRGTWEHFQWACCDDPFLFLFFFIFFFSIQNVKRDIAVARLHVAQTT
jgi:hypothetical protein